MKKGLRNSAHILIDLRWMIPGYTGGIEIVARNVLAELLKFDSRNHYTVLLPAAVRYDFDVRGKTNFHLLTSDGPGHYLAKAGFLVQQAWARSRGKALQGTWIQARRTTAQVALSISGAIAADLYPLKNVLVVHDLQHEYLPGFFSQQELAGRRRDLQNSIEHANQIIAISEYTRHSLSKCLGIALEKVLVAYPGINPIFTPRQSARDSSPAPLSDAQILQQYRLTPGNYIFYPANTWQHKNHRLILEAMVILLQKHAITLQLVCTGTPKEAHAMLLQKVKEYRLEQQCLFIGYCPYEELPALYRDAAALVFPSLFEGFGMPVLEAMASGCPVICSNTTSLPEIAGEAALLVDPTDADAWADGIAQMLRSSSQRQAMIQAGFAQASQYSWQSFPRQILSSLSAIDIHINMPEISDNASSRSPQTNGQKYSLLSKLAGWSYQLDRTGKANRLVKTARALFKNRNPAAGIFKMINAALLAPEVVYITWLFPWFRDHCLRKLFTRVNQPAARQ